MSGGGTSSEIGQVQVLCWTFHILGDTGIHCVCQAKDQVMLGDEGEEGLAYPQQDTPLL